MALVLPIFSLISALVAGDDQNLFGMSRGLIKDPAHSDLGQG